MRNIAFLSNTMAFLQIDQSKLMCSMKRRMEQVFFNQSVLQLCGIHLSSDNYHQSKWKDVHHILRIWNIGQVWRIELMPFRL